jgi:hypothetical protein
MKSLLSAAAMLVLAAALGSAQVPPIAGATIAPPRGSPGTSSALDTNGDGVVDYSVVYDRGGLVAEEDMDSNFDGKMDTFYYYRGGDLQRVEIDSNFDGKVDIWIAVLDGKFVTGYQRDTDGDGKADLVKDFGKG